MDCPRFFHSFSEIDPRANVSFLRLAIYPLAYGLTGLCIALIMSPTALAAVVGFVAGVLLGAAVYNNSLKHQLSGRPTGPPHVQ